jgi:hypothetical protein
MKIAVSGALVAAMSDQNDSLGCLGFGILIVAVIWWGGAWIDWLWYSATYMVLPNQVEVQTKPKDCDFIQAPIGSKGCYYKAVVAAFNPNGDLVGGDNAPRYGRDKTKGNPIVSYDNGTSWVWLLGATNIPSRKIDKVVVSWTKVED